MTNKFSIQYLIIGLFLLTVVSCSKNDALQPTEEIAKIEGYVAGYDKVAMERSVTHEPETRASLESINKIV